MSWLSSLINKIADTEKIAMGEELMMQGALVDMVIQTVREMFNRGAPTTIDDYGFNQTHYNNPNLHEIASAVEGSELPVAQVALATQAFLTYSNRQIPMAREMRKQYQEQYQALIAEQGVGAGTTQVAPAADQDFDEQGNLVVRLLGEGQYGKIRVYIPQSEQRLTANLLNSHMRVRAEALNWEQVANDYGKYDYEIWKAFSRSRTEANIVEVRPDFVQGLIAALEDYNGKSAAICKRRKVDCALYDYSALENMGAGEGATKQALPPVRVLESNETSVKLSFPYDQEAIAKVKELPYQNRVPKKEWNGWTWILRDLGPKETWLQIINNIFPSNKFDTTELITAINSMSEQLQPEVPLAGTEQLIPLQVQNVSQMGNGFLMGITFPPQKETRTELLEFIKFSFPKWGEGGMRLIDKPDDRRDRRPWKYLLNGTYAEFVNFAEILKSRNFDVSQYRQVFGELLKAGIIEKGHVDGRLDGFTPDTPEATVAFDERINGMAVEGISPYDKQLDGVRHLYSRRSAFLGDETGAGKTIQGVLAANAIMEDHGGRALIITLRATHIQWQQHIHKYLGDEEEISADPGSGAKWTVMYYHQFSDATKVGETTEADPRTGLKKKVPIRRRDQLTQLVKDQNYSCLIMDECHNVKNESTRSYNIVGEESKGIEGLAESIPYRWGMSATVSANKPIDVYRQLKGIGHTLGELSKGQFKRFFGGMVPGGYGGAYIDGTPEEQQEAAQNLRKWLALSGVYIRRSKRDMNPNLPNHTIEQLPVELKPAMLKRLEKAISQRMSEYADPDKAISQMIAERTELATAKVPHSLEMVENVLNQDKKVLIFTCFVESAQKLMDGASKLATKQGGYAHILIGGDNQRDQKIQDFKTDPNCRVLVLSILVGGTGIDLPNVVDDVIINDFSWTPKDAEQAEGRAFRVTSENDVNTKYVVAAGTVDEDFYNGVQRKIYLARIIQDIDRDYAEEVRAGHNKAKILELEQRRAKHEAEMRQSDAELKGKIKARQGKRASSWRHVFH